ncbi:FMN-binding [Candidatus Nanopelagicaceae bacterium]
MKRAILIATGTVGGLGAVLAITPPTFTSTESSSMALPGATVDPAGSASTLAATQSAAPTKSATAAATAKATPSKLAATNNSQNQTPAATPTKAATVAPVKKAASGTFTGDSVDVRYGYVQVKITVENGKITDAQAVVAPSGRNDRWTQMSVPVLRQQTLQAQSANINGVSGASFTSYGWYTSLVSALAKAGM